VDVIHASIAYFREGFLNDSFDFVSKRRKRSNVVGMSPSKRQYERSKGASFGPCCVLVYLDLNFIGV